MDNWLNQCGRVPNFFSSEQIKSFVNYMQYLPGRPDAQGNSYHVISFNSGHQSEWFKQHVLSIINQHFGIHSHLLIAEMIECHSAGNVHHDIKPLPTYHGRHWLTFLIPVDVDDDPDLCDQTSTMIFQQNIGSKSSVDKNRLYEEFPLVDDNVRHLADTQLKHVTPQWLNRLTVLDDLVWNSGDLLWWDSGLAHCSTDLGYNGVKRKRSIILFTYRDR